MKFRYLLATTLLFTGAAATWIPGTGIKLKKSKIRGIESSGMLCSEAELGLSDDHQGIIELAGDADVPLNRAVYKLARQVEDDGSEPGLRWLDELLVATVT